MCSKDTPGWYIGFVRMLLLSIAFMVSGQAARAQQTVSFSTSDGGCLYADSYGTGDRGVVLAHGGQFAKESWAPQARVLAAAGFRVLAIDFRGFGKSHGPGDKDFDTAPFQLDVLAAVGYLKAAGVRHISAIGASFGGSAVGDASIGSSPGQIEGVVMLAGAPSQAAEKLHSASLWIVAREDTSGDGPRLPGIRAQFEKAPEPKKLVVLDGSAHAQFLFKTDQGDRVVQEILAFLHAKSAR